MYWTVRSVRLSLWHIISSKVTYDALYRPLFCFLQILYASASKLPLFRARKAWWLMSLVVPRCMLWKNRKGLARQYFFCSLERCSTAAELDVSYFIFSYTSFALLSDHTSFGDTFRFERNILALLCSGHAICYTELTLWTVVETKANAHMHCHGPIIALQIILGAIPQVLQAYTLDASPLIYSRTIWTLTRPTNYQL